MWFSSSKMTAEQFENFLAQRIHSLDLLDGVVKARHSSNTINYCFDQEYMQQLVNHVDWCTVLSCTQNNHHHCTHQDKQRDSNKQVISIPANGGHAKQLPRGDSLLNAWTNQSLIPNSARGRKNIFWEAAHQEFIPEKSSMHRHQQKFV